MQQPSLASNQEAPKKRRPAFNPLQTTLRQQAGVWIIDFVGDLTTFADQEVQKAYQLIPAACAAFVLNFSQCEYINSAGIAVIISLITQTRRKEQSVAAYGLTTHYEKLFYMVGLSDYLDIYADERVAVEKTLARLRSASPPPS